MRRRSGVFLRLPAGACALVLGASCTFPTVDYDDRATAQTAPCPIPPKCSTNAANCSKQADAAQGSCLNKCGNGQSPTTCEKCQTDHTLAITNCLDACEACSAANGCVNATEGCAAILGL